MADCFVFVYFVLFGCFVLVVFRVLGLCFWGLCFLVCFDGLWFWLYFCLRFLVVLDLLTCFMCLYGLWCLRVRSSYLWVLFFLIFVFFFRYYFVRFDFSCFVVLIYLFGDGLVGWVGVCLIRFVCGFYYYVAWLLSFDVGVSFILLVWFGSMFTDWLILFAFECACLRFVLFGFWLLCLVFAFCLCLGVVIMFVVFYLFACCLFVCLGYCCVVLLFV